LAHRSVTHNNCNNAGAEFSQSPSMADPNSGHSALDAIAMKSPVRQVLAASDATASAAFPTHDFGDESVEVAAICQEVTMIAVIRENNIIRVM